MKDSTGTEYLGLVSKICKPRLLLILLQLSIICTSFLRINDKRITLTTPMLRTVCGNAMK